MGLACIAGLAHAQAVDAAYAALHAAQTDTLVAGARERALWRLVGARVAAAHGWLTWVSLLQEKLLAEGRPRFVLASLTPVRRSTPRLRWVTELLRTVVDDVARERSWLVSASGHAAKLDEGADHLATLLRWSLWIRDAAEAHALAREAKGAARAGMTRAFQALDRDERRVAAGSPELRTHRPKPSPASPRSLKRASHLYPVFLLIP